MRAIIVNMYLSGALKFQEDKVHQECKISPYAPHPFSKNVSFFTHSNKRFTADMPRHLGPTHLFRAALNTLRKNN